jgi:hypothetical protein
MVKYAYSSMACQWTDGVTADGHPIHGAFNDNGHVHFLELNQLTPSGAR